MTPAAIVLTAALGGGPAAAAGRMQSMVQVAPNHRFLVRADGTPFFWLADTAWLLFYRLDREEAERYLTARARQGFTVLQVMGIVEFEELRMPNAYGEQQFIDRDPLRPNEKFYAHVDWIIRRAGELGLTIAFLATWGDKVGPVLWGKGPVIFNENVARTYGAWLGTRYRTTPNLIWVLGGDRPPVQDDAPGGVKDFRPVWRAMAAGLKAGDGGVHLMTYHPMGGSSTSTHLHAEPWLDFNMIQSGHGARNPHNWAVIDHDYSLAPPKPTLDGEADYEDHPVNWKQENGWFDDLDVRRTAYWAVFAGAFGHTYGSTPTFLFQKPGTEMGAFGGRRTWEEALALPGANQMKYLRGLVESRPFLTRIPDQSLLVGDACAGPDHAQATRDADGSWAFIYLASGRPVTIRADRLTGTTLTAAWFNPRTGGVAPIGPQPRTGSPTFTPPMQGPGLDWVLVLDDAARAFPPPGGGIQ